MCDGLTIINHRRFRFKLLSIATLVGVLGANGISAEELHLDCKLTRIERKWELQNDTAPSPEKELDFLFEFSDKGDEIGKCSRPLWEFWGTATRNDEFLFCNANIDRPESRADGYRQDRNIFSHDFSVSRFSGKAESTVAIDMRGRLADGERFAISWSSAGIYECKANLKRRF